jgi:hypothetical protein
LDRDHRRGSRGLFTNTAVIHRDSKLGLVDKTRAPIINPAAAKQHHAKEAFEAFAWPVAVMFPRPLFAPRLRAYASTSLRFFYG